MKCKNKINLFADQMLHIVCKVFIVIAYFYLTDNPMSL
ncbi:hypothetical protein phiAS5_ORF0284 [Aeromonas phage phiAS5]|uniref:Uncharacterized protein n=1 Tax=Aeromonas phage phiAS5 TaxID=879630 RepID=E1A238_9CAUD|nr:hypothetical protein phiAS5_ORF0284 [Aeromonas phage phiAS5]ADM80127.1 hypothetical protein phiAS5_ORF0284 [Aeromonas phage phiAS5]